jgi:hypothetical protein
VRAFSLELVMHELTDLPDDAAEFPDRAAANARLLREDTRNLVDAAGDGRGQLYGPGTYYESELPDEPRIHVDAAARRTFEAMDAKGVVVAAD